ncbi:MAG: helix-turn-helix transcriptional regulator [Clostridiaceae bacterium]|nr:helix-turn-helix transcriptional regulator [Clostridiaceae bacterium]
MSANISRVEVSNERLSPKILKSFIFSQGENMQTGYRLKERYVYDYEIEFFTYSKGSMVIDDKLYPISKGDIVFRKPGQFTQGTMPYSCYIACIDMLGNTGKDLLGYDFYSEQNFQNYCINPLLEAIPSVYHPVHEKKYYYLFDSILKEFINPSQGAELILKSYTLNLIYQLYHDVSDPLTNSSMTFTPHFKMIKRVMEHIEKNLEKKILLSDMAKLSDLSPNHFHRVFSQTTGFTPNEFITKLRIDRAKDLLVRTNSSVSEISLQCGFENIPYFSYLFKKQVNLSPGEFRKRHSFI